MDNQVRDDVKRREKMERGAWIRLIFVGCLLVAIFTAIGVHIYKYVLLPIYRYVFRPIGRFFKKLFGRRNKNARA